MISWFRGLFSLMHYKLFAVLVATAGWLYVQGSETVEFKQRAALAWKLPDGLVPTEPQPASVMLTVTGSRNAVRRTGEASLTIAIDLTEHGLGPGGFDLANLPVSGLPQNVEVASYNPSGIQFVLDERDRRNVSLRPEIVGKPGSGFVVSGVELDPSVIAITGPRVVVEGLHQLITKPIDVSDLTASALISVDISLPRSVGLAEGQVTVKARVSVQPILERKSFSELPVVVLRAPGWHSDGALISVVLEGPTEALNAVQGDRIFGIVHLPDDPNKKSYTAAFGPTEGLRLELSIPSDNSVRVVSCDPPSIEVIRQ